MKACIQAIQNPNGGGDKSSPEVVSHRNSLSQARPVSLTETSGVRREKRSEDRATAFYSSLPCKSTTVPQEGCGINASDVLLAFGSMLLHVTSDVCVAPCWS